MEKIIIKNKVLCYNVEWIIWDKKEFIEYLEKITEVDIDDLDCWYSCIADEVWYIYLWDKSDFVLLHEIIHIVQAILNSKWIDTWYSNTEILAYNVEWIIWDKKEFIEYLEKITEVDIDDLDCWYSCIADEVWYIYLWDKSDFVLLHEIIHIVQAILNSKWIDTWYSNTEILAYNVDWCFKNLLYKYYKLIWNDKYKNYR
jgi:hypothetical protein